MEGDKVEFVEILSERGGQCILRNPWPNGDVTIYRNGKEAGQATGKLLALSTEMGERIVLTLKGHAATAKTIQ